jgi:L-threonylcarbamoyladenylate synthase
VPTEILRLDPERPDCEALEHAASVLRAGGLVAFPTETVYGLGAHALDPDAVRRVFEAKGRPSFNPLIIHVADAGAAERLAARWPDSASRLAERFWPGPLTLVVPRGSAVPDIVTAGLETVALRVPAHRLALALLRASSLPLAAPSANRYTEISPTTAEHVVKGLSGRVDLILDGGPTDLGIESTVLDLTGDRVRMLRPGSISAAEIEDVVGPLESFAAATVEGAPQRSPGLARRHYAPRARLLLARPDDPAAAGIIREARAAGQRVGAIGLGAPPAEVDHRIRMPRDPAAYAARIYAALHQLDDLGCDLVLVEGVPASPEWLAVRDRLARAAAS